MGWLVFNFECETPAGCESLVQWFEENHEVERKRPESSTAPGGPGGGAGSEDGVMVESDEEHAPGIDTGGPGVPEVAADVVLSTDDEPIEGEMVWIDQYLYLTVTESPGPLLEETAAHWNRAVQAQIETRKGGCRVAVLYSTIGSHAIEVERLQGRPSNAALDVMYEFAMIHQFRFRAYADILPTICTIPFPSAFHTPDETDPESDRFQKMAEITGVEPTPEGIRFLERDPMRADAARPSLGPRERLASLFRTQVVRPARAALVAVRARF